MTHQGQRFNQGKLRYDLIPPFAQQEYARVLTAGAQKYAPRNWERGLSWTQTAGSLMRHLEAFMRGEDYDPETGILHTAHIMCNAGFLTEFYRIYPQGDDRPHHYTRMPRIGLDVDEVIADFISAYCKKFNIENVPEMWNFDIHHRERMDALKDDKDFWMSIKPLIDPKDIPFEPFCYITSRIIPNEWTEEWIARNGFPTRPVYSVGSKPKLDVIKQHEVELFVDDRYENFCSITNGGVCCFLMDAPHNQRYNVGHKRIKSLKELPFVAR